MADARRRLPLRARAALGMGLTAFLLGTALALFGYSIIRHQLVDERQRAVLRQSYTNARLVRSGLRAADVDVTRLLGSLQVTNEGGVLLHLHGRWYGSAVDVDRRELPKAVRDLVERGHAAHQRVEVGGTPLFVVGVPIAESQAEYYQVVPLSDIDRTMARLLSSLTLATVLATLLAVAVGAVTSRAVLRPLSRMAESARRVRQGDLGTRLSADGDPDLIELVVAFNEMLGELQDRIDREARFASDVAHEVRGPLMVLASAVEIVNRRRNELPETAVKAVDALQQQVETFNELVLDLLEISRFDAGAAALQTTRFDLVALVRHTLEEAGCGGTPVTGSESVEVVADARRIHQALANLVQNAQRYAGGVVAVHVSISDVDQVQVVVEDRGPGVPAVEREQIFARFHRGTAGTERGAPSGSGLGLALVQEHLALHGGRVRVEDNRPTGSRFVLELPREAP